MSTLQEGLEYETIDGKTVVVKKQLSGSFKDISGKTNRYFTANGGCIAYYRGMEPIIEEQRSIEPEEIERVNNYDGPPDNPNPGEPEITNEERLTSGMVKPR